MSDEKRLKGLMWLGTAGTLLILGGIISILAANWVSVPFVVQVILALAPLAVSLVGWHWYRKRQMPAIEIEEVLGATWAGSVLCAVALLARVLQLPSDGFMFCVTMSVLLAAVTIRLRSTFALLTQMGFVLAISMDRLASSGGVSEWVALLALLLCGALLLPRMREVWYRQTATALVLRYLIAFWVNAYVCILGFLVIEMMTQWTPLECKVLTMGLFFTAQFFIGIWLDEGRPMWNRPLTLVATLTLGTFALMASFSPTSTEQMIMAGVMLVPMVIFLPKVIRSECALFFIVPTVCLLSPFGMLGNIGVIAVSTALLVLGLLRGSRFVANFSMLFLLAFCFCLMAQYDAELMLIGVVFVISGVLFLVVNLCFTRFSQRLIQRFPSLAEPSYLPPISLSDSTKAWLKRLASGLAIAICVGQVVVPGWLLLKRHLILTCGKRYELKVKIYDPRDLFAGKYVSLGYANSEREPLLEEFVGVKRNYLRYYCDERYAGAYERLIRKTDRAILVVRLWRGQALAEELLINGQPAHEYVKSLRQLSPEAQAEQKAREMMVAMSPQMAVAMSLFSYDALKKVSANFPHRDEGGYIPFYLGIDTVWEAFFKEIKQPVDPRTIPHPIWMDRWMNGAEVPNAAFLPVTPEQRVRRIAKIDYSWKWKWDHQLMFPAFTGLPVGVQSDLSFDELAKHYYIALQKTYTDANLRIGKKTTFFTTQPPATAERAMAIWQGMQAAFTETKWVIFTEDGVLPNGFPWDLPKDCLVLVSPKQPEVGVDWVYVPSVGMPLDAVKAPMLDSATQCVGWMMNASLTEPIADAYWVSVLELMTDLNETFTPEVEVETLRAEIEKAYQLNERIFEEDERRFFALLGMTLRQEIAQGEGNPERRARLALIETALKRAKYAQIFKYSQSAEDYAQWHLRTEGVLPNWQEVSSLDAEELMRMLWRELYGDRPTPVATP